MKNFTILILSLGLVSAVHAQNLSTHYLYQLNWLNINPAYTGETEDLQLIFNPGTQMVGVNGNPTNSMLGLHGNVRPNVGLGGKIVIDQRGAFTNLTSEILYSYKVKLSQDHRFNFGVSAGAYHTGIDESAVVNGRYTELADPVFNSDYYNSTRFIASFGALYKYRELDLGVSLPHMVVSGRPISDHVFGTAKYDFHTRDQQFTISPMLVYQHLSKSPGLLDIGAKVMWDKTIWTQFSYRSNSTMGAALGVNIKGFTIGYLYNINNSPLDVISKGSHQVFISFTFSRNKKVKPDGSSRLNAVLSDLKNLTNSEAENPEVHEEIQKIREELSALLAKLNDGTYSEEDDMKLKELEDRINRLKQEFQANE